MSGRIWIRGQRCPPICKISPWSKSKKAEGKNEGRGPGSDDLSQASNSPAQNSDKSGSFPLEQPGLPASASFGDLKRAKLPGRRDACKTGWDWREKPCWLLPYMLHAIHVTTCIACCYMLHLWQGLREEHKNTRAAASWGGKKELRLIQRKRKWVFSE